MNLPVELVRHIMFQVSNPKTYLAASLTHSSFTCSLSEKDKAAIRLRFEPLYNITEKGNEYYYKYSTTYSERCDRMYMLLSEFRDGTMLPFSKKNIMDGLNSSGCYYIRERLFRSSQAVKEVLKSIDDFFTRALEMGYINRIESIINS